MTAIKQFFIIVNADLDDLNSMGITFYYIILFNIVFTSTVRVRFFLYFTTIN